MREGRKKVNKLNINIRERKSSKSNKGVVYEYYFNLDGKRYSKSGFKTKKDAKDQGKLKYAEVTLKKQEIEALNPTLNEVYDEFCDVCDNYYQFNTVYITKQYSKIFLNKFGEIPIRDIDFHMIQKFFDSRSNVGYGNNLGLKTAVNRIFVYAIRQEYLDKNVVQYVKISGISTEKENKKVVTKDEFDKLIKEIYANGMYQKDQIRKRSYVIAMMLGYYAGLRISEVFALTKNDFDLEKGTVYVNKKMIYHSLKENELYIETNLKTKKSKATLPLSPALIKELREWFEINPYDKIITDKNGNYLHPRCMMRTISYASKRLGFEITFHGLRHSFATNLFNNGVNVKIAQELMRHSNFNTTMNVYTHINDDEKRNAINTVYQSMSKV